MPKISVVMSVYNGLPYLENAINSILGQDYTDFEFIVINDGSTDGSTEVLRRFAQEDRRIRLIEQKNKGLTPSLNKGASVAKGEYIARMDADDISLPRRFSVQAKYLDQHPDCVLVGGQVVLIDEEERPVLDSCSPPSDSKTGRVQGLWGNHTQIEQALLDGKWPLVHPAVMMRRDAVVQIGGYDERFEGMEDHDLFLRLAEVGALKNISKVILRYRRHESQVTGQPLTVQNYYMRVIRRKGYIRREEPLPADLEFPSIFQSWVGQGLRKTVLWPTALKLYNAIRSDNLTRGK